MKANEYFSLSDSKQKISVARILWGLLHDDNFIEQNKNYQAVWPLWPAWLV